MKAWIDLTNRKNSGVHVNSDDIAKHRSDIFRLFAVLSTDTEIPLEDSVIQDMKEGINRLKANPHLNLKDFGLRKASVNEVVDTLTRIYGLGA
jgi:hypothetical protein